MEVSINGARILATFENVPIFGTVQITQTLAVAWLVMLIISALCNKVCKLFVCHSCPFRYCWNLWEYKRQWAAALCLSL